MARKLTKKSSFSPRLANLHTIYDKDDNVIDEAIVIYFKAPHSFTGEDIVEFQCHGGTIVASLMLENLLHFGAKLAQPGEFSKRAFLNGKIDLTKAEAIAKLIEAKSVDSAKLLARQVKGELKGYLDDLRRDLVEILAFIEVNIDYAEEDLPQNIFSMIEDKLKSISSSLQKSYDSSKRKDGLLHGFHVAIIGKPNVGKSSLLNSLLEDDKAIISDIAGTTRDLIQEELKLGTHLVKIIDTAGIRNTDEAIEKIGVEKAKKSINEANIIIALFDGSRAKDEEDSEIEELIKKYKDDKKIFTIINKSDLPQLFNPLPKEHIKVSCKNSVEPIIKALTRYLDTQNSDDSVIFTTSRQINEVGLALNAIENAKELLGEHQLELFAFEINQSLEHIASITKSYSNDEILDSMFSNFCLGK